MRSIVFALVCVAAAASGCSGVQATTRRQKDWTRKPAVVPFAKVYRGTTNIALSPLDVPATAIRKVRQARGIVGTADAAVMGTGEGVVNGVSRMTAGALEVLSFPLVYQPSPYYERKLGEPAFPLTKRKPPRRR